MARKFSLTNTLFRAARLSADFRAIRKGPRAIVARLIRKAVYRRTGGATASLLRQMGL